jgi:hypothetical protein
MRGRFAEIDEDNTKEAQAFGEVNLKTTIEGIEYLKRAEKIDGDVNLAADKILDDKALKKIRILQLKEGVRKVDRHGFRDDEYDMKDKMEKEAGEQALRDEYIHKMKALIAAKRGNKWDEIKEMEAANMSDEEMEEGEDDMEEGEEEEDFIGMEEQQDDDEFVSEDNEDDIPEAIPIEKDTVGINHANKSDDSGVSDIDVDDYGTSSEEYDSDELDNATTENPHGFVFANMLETFSKSKMDRIEEMREARDAEAM